MTEERHDMPEMAEVAAADEGQPRKLKRRLIKWVIGILLFPFVILLLAGALLYLPPIQKLAVDIVSSEVSSATGWNVTVGSIRLGFPLHLKVNKVLALGSAGDTIAHVAHLQVDVPLTPLFKGNIPISYTALDGAVLNFFTPDSTLWLKGRIDKLRVHNANINLKESKMSFSNVKLADADVYVFVNDTTTKAPDTLSQPTDLRIYFGKVDMERVSGAFAMDRDTDIVSGDIHIAKLANGEINLKESYYQAQDIQLEARLHKAGPDLDFLPSPWDIRIDAYKAHYDSINVYGTIKKASVLTGDGWEVRSLSAKVSKDAERFVINDIDLSLKASYLTGDADLPFEGWIPDKTGEVALDLQGRIIPDEVKRFFAPETEFPDVPIDLALSGKGRMDNTLRVKGKIEAGDILALNIDGTAKSLMEEHRSAKMSLKVTTGRVMEHLALFGIENPSWTLPSHLDLEGDVIYSATRMSAQTTITTPKGHLTADGFYAPRSRAFKANVSLYDVDVRQFLPRDTIGSIRAHIVAEGQGTDPFAPETEANLFVVVDSVEYMHTSLKGITLLSELKNHQLFAALNSENDDLGVSAQVDALLKKNDVVASINLLVDTIVPAKIGIDLGVLQAASLELRSSLRSDLKEYYDFRGEIEDALLSTDRGLIRPTNIYINALTSSDSIRAGIRSGDLRLDFMAENGLNDFTDRISKLSKEIQSFTADTTGITDMSPWLALYPDMKLTFSMERSNPLRTYLDELYLGWKKVKLEIGTTTGTGLAGELYVNHFQKDAFRVDAMDVVIRQDSSFFYAVASVHKEKYMDQAQFEAMLSLTSNVHRTELFTRVNDESGNNFLQIGIDMNKEPDNDLRFSFTPDPQILAYNIFSVKGGNYVILPAANRMRILADLRLETDDNTAIVIRDLPEAPNHTLSALISDFNLNKVKDLAFIPDMDGVLNLNAMWVQTSEGDDYIASAGIDHFMLDKKRVGTIRAEGSLTPKEKGSYAIAKLALDSVQVVSAKAFLPKDSRETMRWHTQVMSLPLDKANPFLPKDIIEMSGLLHADLYNYNIKDSIGTSQTTAINGALSFGRSSLFIPKINQSYTLDSREIVIRKDVLYLDRFALETNRNTHLTTHGTVTLNDRFDLNVNLKGDDMILLDSKRTDKTVLYGLISADADINLKGSAQALAVTGRLAVNGNTNVTYVAQDSPLESRNKFDGLISFTDFSDTLFVARKAPVDSLTLGGMNVRLAIHIDPALRVTALLTKDEANKAYIQGGGDLNFRMPPYGTMSLNGVFEIGDGYVNYNLPPISRRFNVDRDSRITWSGNVMNPNIDFKATSRIKADVASDDDTSRKVNFDVSIVAKNNVENIGLYFTMDSPEDLAMRNTISAMTDEERSRQAIMLLATGTYIGSQGARAGGFDVNATLSSLFASQLNSLIGEALNAEFNFGIAGAQESSQGTNYSYSIAKKFYNDRISVMVGGQVETGNNTQQLQQSFINNMSIDYRLDQAGTHYVRLFHKKNYENLLDGEVIETGVGYVLRRRLDRLGDLFRFKVRPKSTTLPTDTVPPAAETPSGDANIPKEDDEK